MQQGKAKAREEFRKLTEAMEKDGSLNQIPRLFTDDEFLEEMKKKYQI